MRLSPRRDRVSFEFGTFKSERARFGRGAIDGLFRIRRDDRDRDGRTSVERSPQSLEFFPKRTATTNASVSPRHAFNQLGDLAGKTRRRIVGADLAVNVERAARHIPFGLRRSRSPIAPHGIPVDHLNAVLYRSLLAFLLVDEKRIRRANSKRRKLMVVSLDVFSLNDQVRRALRESLFRSAHCSPD